MKHYKRILSLLGLLLTAATGAWAQDDPTVNFPSEITAGEEFSFSFDASDNVESLELEFDDESKTFSNIKSNKGTLNYKYNGDLRDGTEVNLIFTYVDDNGESSVQQHIIIHDPAPATYPFPITWDAKNKTTGFNLPAGNVFMNVEYYPVAELTTAPAAKSDIKATTDDAIVTAGTVAKIGETENAQGTLMYYAVQSETAPDAPDYDNKGWSDKVPTAADFNEGNVYVWYYVKGADGGETTTFSDGAITKLGESGYVTLAAAPTYAITLTEGTEDADKWTISQAEAIKGNKVTATYSGTKKVIGMTVTKRVSLAYPIVISEVTDEAYIGSVVAADGYVYATLDDVDNASKTAVAKICYVGSETGDATYKHGLALALRDVSEIKSWCSQSNNTCLVSQYTTVAEAKGDLAGIANTDVLVGTTPHSHGDNAAKAARGYNSGTHPDGTSEWFLPSVGQWDKMATAVGDYLKLGLIPGYYWSSTEIDAENAWTVHVDDGSWSTGRKYYNQGIRACLAF